MPCNIEIKARVRDPAALKARAAALTDTPVEIIPQEDIFFHADRGRLKLRILAPERGQLVCYTRPDSAGPKKSEYEILETGAPEELKAVLASALGIRGVVRKTRCLYRLGRTRIHLDEVEELGSFMELEVVLLPGQDEAEGLAIAESLMNRLGIGAEDLIQCAYIDLIEKNSRISP